MLALGREDLVDEVADDGVVLERDDAVPEPLREVDGRALDPVEAHRIPVPERRRAEADIDDVVDGRPVRHRDVLGLARRHLREVDAAHDAAARDRGVALAQLERVADGLGERLEAVVLIEHSALVGELARRHREGAGHR